MFEILTSTLRIPVRKFSKSTPGHGFNPWNPIGKFSIRYLFQANRTFWVFYSCTIEILLLTFETPSMRTMGYPLSLSKLAILHPFVSCIVIIVHFSKFSWFFLLFFFPLDFLEHAFVATVDLHPSAYGRATIHL